MVGSCFSLHLLYYAEACNELAGPINASLRPGFTAPFEEMSQRWRAVGNTASELGHFFLRSNYSSFQSCVLPWFIAFSIIKGHRHQTKEAKSLNLTMKLPLRLSHFAVVCIIVIVLNSKINTIPNRTY